MTSGNECEIVGPLAKRNMNKSKSNSLTPLIVEAERVVKEAIKFFALKTDPNSICVTVQSKGRRNAVGWFWAGRWVSKQDKKSKAFNEINMSAEHLVDHHMGELMLHELAHAENNTEGIKDCSGRVHNKHFKSMAERLGLEVKPRDKSVGFGFTDLAQGAKDFLKGIKFDEALFSTYRGPTPKTCKVGSRMLKCECPDCGYVARITLKWINVGLPTCPCGQEMKGDV